MCETVTIKVHPHNCPGFEIRFFFSKCLLTFSGKNILKSVALVKRKNVVRLDTQFIGLATPVQKLETFLTFLTFLTFVTFLTFLTVSLINWIISSHIPLLNGLKNSERKSSELLYFCFMSLYFDFLKNNLLYLSSEFDSWSRHFFYFFYIFNCNERLSENLVQAHRMNFNFRSTSVENFKINW